MTPSYSVLGRAAVAAVVVVLGSCAMAGCGTGDGSTAADRSGSSPSGTSEPGTSPPTTPSTTPSPTRDPSGPLGKIRVVGEVVSVGDCVVVRDGNAITWTLTGDGVADLTLGERVSVTGSPDLLATGCEGSLVRVRTIDVLG